MNFKVKTNLDTITLWSEIFLKKISNEARTEFGASFPLDPVVNKNKSSFRQSVQTTADKSCAAKGGPYA